MRNLTRSLITLAIGAAAGSALTLSSANAQRAANSVSDWDEIDAVLTDFHAAAADADFVRYFDHFATGALFLGTDKFERWTVEQFMEYADPHFAAGNGWVYELEDAEDAREIVIGHDADVAWFDERLVGAKYGSSRGVGAMVKEMGEWKIAIYGLHFPIPNEIAPDMTQAIKEWEWERERLENKAARTRGKKRD
jgi:hypothetical protein